MTRRHKNVGLLLAAVLTLVGVATLTRPASADRKYFVESYTTYLAPAGSLELENTVTALTGKQDPTQHTAWEQRVEFEYAISNHLTGAAYLNYSQASGEGFQFVGPSVEFIYRLAAPGRIFGDPALYLETSESGTEMELEPKLLLSHREGRFVSALNLVGEFEYRHNNEELLGDGTVLSNEFKGEISAGIAYELSPQIAVALETRYRAEYPNFGPRADAVFSLGPTINLQSGRVQLAIGVLPQLWGSPQTSGQRNLVDFEKTQVRGILGIEL